MENRTPRLWNPIVAVRWAFLFSPVFGALIQAKNWQELGRPDEARRSMLWVYGGSAYLLLVLAVAGAVPDNAGMPLGLIFYALWALYGGQRQVNFVKEAGDYEKKPWTVPIISGVVATACFLALGILIGTARAPTLKQRVEATAPGIVTRIVQKRLKPELRCQSVKILEDLPGGIYRGEARLDDGRVLKVVMKVSGDQLTIEQLAQ